MTIATVVLCDTCDAVYVPAEHPRGAVSRLAHADGWTSTNRNGIWTNECPDHNTDTKE